MIEPGLRLAVRAVVLALLLGIAGAAAAGPPPLKAPQDFAAVSDRAERSRALFTEAGKVLQHPRCLNCHPVGASPTQGDNLQLHQPPVVRGVDGFGAVGMRCGTCHQAQNYEPSGVPGDPHWHLAPAEMAWQQRSLGDICAQLKDPKRNGGRSLAQIHDHMARDHLVGWGWHPGGQREPAPGTQEQFGQLIAAWIENGAECPR